LLGSRPVASLRIDVLAFASGIEALVRISSVDIVAVVILAFGIPHLIQFIFTVVVSNLTCSTVTFDVHAGTVIVAQNFTVLVHSPELLDVRAVTGNTLNIVVKALVIGSIVNATSVDNSTTVSEVEHLIGLTGAGVNVSVSTACVALNVKALTTGTVSNFINILIDTSIMEMSNNCEIPLLVFRTVAATR